MKTILTIIGILLIIMGGIWILQGTNVLPGSSMTGQIRWAVYGAVAVVVGFWIIVWVNRRKSPRPKKIV